METDGGLTRGMFLGSFFLIPPHPPSKRLQGPYKKKTQTGCTVHQSGGVASTWLFGASFIRDRPVLPLRSTGPSRSIGRPCSISLFIRLVATQAYMSLYSWLSDHVTDRLHPSLEHIGFSSYYYVLTLLIWYYTMASALSNLKSKQTVLFIVVIT